MVVTQRALVGADPAGPKKSYKPHTHGERERESGRERERERASQIVQEDAVVRIGFPFYLFIPL